MQFPII